MSAHWHELGIDVLLTPVGPTPAPKLETAKYWNVSPLILPLALSSRQYTSYWNLANYPAAVFPTGLLVDPSVDSAAYAATNADEEWIKQTFSAGGSVGVGTKATCVAELLTDRLRCHYSLWAMWAMMRTLWPRLSGWSSVFWLRSLVECVSQARSPKWASCTDAASTLPDLLERSSLAS